MVIEPDPVKIKRVLVLAEFEDGTVGAVYSEDLEDDATVETQQRAPDLVRWQDGSLARRPERQPWRAAVRGMRSLIFHTPDNRGITLEAVTAAAMDRWKEAGE